SSHEEGCTRHWGISTKAFLGDENDQLRAALVVDLEWETDASGRPIKFSEIKGSEREIPCELVTLAMGFLHPQHAGLLEQLGVALTERGNVDANEQDYHTNLPKVF